MLLLLFDACIQKNEANVKRNGKKKWKGRTCIRARPNEWARVWTNECRRRNKESKREMDAETNQWHMIVCIYCRTDSFASSHVVQRQRATVRHRAGERKKTRALLCVFMWVCLCISIVGCPFENRRRCRRSFVMYSIMSLLVARYHLETHYFVLFGALVLAFECVCVRASMSLFHDISVRTCVIAASHIIYLTVPFALYNNQYIRVYALCVGKTFRFLYSHFERSIHISHTWFYFQQIMLF